jgi:hypothetical protein
MHRNFAYSARYLFKARLRFRRLPSEEESMSNWILAIFLSFFAPANRSRNASHPIFKGNCRSR